MPRRSSRRTPRGEDAEHGTAGQFFNGLFTALDELDALPSPGDRGLPVLRGVNANGTSTRPFDSVLAEGTDILVASQRLFVYRNNVVLEQQADGRKRLVPLTSGGKVLAHAPSLLANVFTVSNN